MEEWEAVEAEVGSAATSVDTDVDTDAEHPGRELEAEEAAEAADGQGDDLDAAAATGAEPADGIAAAASGAEAIPRASAGTCVVSRNACYAMSLLGQTIKIRVYQQWPSDEEAGPRAQSRSIRPTIYGEATTGCPNARSSCEPGPSGAWR